MIATVTLNASIDKAYRLSQPLADRTVMRVSEVIDNAGGKGLNTARAIATCGEDALACGFVGGHNGEYLCDLLDRDGIAHDFVRVGAETRCCINILEPDGASTEFLEPGRAVTAGELERLMQDLEQRLPSLDAITLNGSYPKGLPEDTYARIISLAKKAGKPCILDTSGTALAASLKACPTLVKPNKDEIGQIVGHEVASLDEVADAARHLHGQGIPYVVVSLGGDGALMACDEGCFHARAPRIEVVNPVGSGDTMVGAFAVALARKMDARSMLAFAISCATANCLSASTGHFAMEQAKELLAETVVEEA